MHHLSHFLILTAGLLAGATWEAVRRNGSLDLARRVIGLGGDPNPHDRRRARGDTA